MPEITSVRTTAEAIGRITCIKTGEEIGLLYQWDNGKTQAAIYEDGSTESLGCQNQVSEQSLSAKRS